MRYYRAYLLDDDNHFISVKEIVCSDDVSAVEAAKQFMDDHAIELWECERLVNTLPKLS